MYASDFCTCLMPNMKTAKAANIKADIPQNVIVNDCLAIEFLILAIRGFTPR